MSSKTFAMLLGIVLMVVGLWGMATGGHDHLLVVFGVNASHNLVHLLSGAAAIGCALAGERYSRGFCLIFGVVYGLVALLGFLNVDSVVTLLNLNMADNFLHLGIAAACLLVGWRKV